MNAGPERTEMIPTLQIDKGCVEIAQRHSAPVAETAKHRDRHHCLVGRNTLGRLKTARTDGDEITHPIEIGSHAATKGLEHPVHPFILTEIQPKALGNRP